MRASSSRSDSCPITSCSTGYRITPVVALLQPGFTLQPRRHRGGRGIRAAARRLRWPPPTIARVAARCSELEFEVWELPYGERNIWGATAGILANLREVLGRGARA